VLKLLRPAAGRSEFIAVGLAAAPAPPDAGRRAGVAGCRCDVQTDAGSGAAKARAAARPFSSKPMRAPRFLAKESLASTMRRLDSSPGAARHVRPSMDHRAALPPSRAGVSFAETACSSARRSPRCRA